MLLNKQIYNYFAKNKLFAKSKYGFRTSKSTLDAVCCFVGRCYDGLENGLPVEGYFFDLTKAFDTVDQEILLQKLKFYGFDNGSTALLSSYLMNRQQAVYVNGTFSKFHILRHGVPQGSVLGPVLFLIYINDLPACIRDECLETYMFADDLAININLNKDVKLIDDIIARVELWCNSNRLALNSNKTENIKFSLNRNSCLIKKSGHSSGVRLGLANSC